jgi:hypothetical protein
MIDKPEGYDFRIRLSDKEGSNYSGLFAPLDALYQASEDIKKNPEATDTLFVAYWVKGSKPGVRYLRASIAAKHPDNALALATIVQSAMLDASRRD